MLENQAGLPDPLSRWHSTYVANVGMITSSPEIDRKCISHKIQSLLLYSLSCRAIGNCPDLIYVLCGLSALY